MAEIHRVPIFVIYHPFKIGDFINASEYGLKGYVIDISLRHTVIETLEKTRLIIPNTILNKAIVENISDTLDDIKINHLLISIDYDSDVDLAKKIIREEVCRHPLYVKTGDIIPIYMINLGEYSLELRVDIPTKDNIDGFALMSDLRETLLKRFKENDISIPYPHNVIINRK